MPVGRDLSGFLRFPDIDKPASIPVTAGKKIAKTFQKPTLLLSLNSTCEKLSRLECFPIKKEIKEARIRLKTRSCIFNAKSAELYAKKSENT